MKTIGSFKLHKRGEEGISITSVQLSKHFKPVDGVDINNQIYHDEINTYRRDSVPRHILDAIDRLKYFFLNITGYWISLYDRYMDMSTLMPTPADENVKEGRKHLQSLWEATYVTQVKFDHNSFTIMGMMEVIDGKPLNLNPMKVTPDDDLPFYEDARGAIQVIIKFLIDYFSTAAISNIDDYRKYLLEHSDETGKGEIAKFDDDQIFNRIVDKFHKQGMFVMMENDIPAIESNSEAVQEDVEAPDADFEPDPVEPEETSEAESEDPEMNAGDDWSPQPDKAPDPFGQPAAEDGQAEAVSENLEMTEGVDHIDESSDGLDDVPDEDFV